MKKIGEISAQYHISNRMLRYYEEKGIIKSSRGENNYRYYDVQSEQRIGQICLLKELDFSIKEIDQIFSATNSIDLIQILYHKKTILKDKIEQYNQLSAILNNFISLLLENNNPFFKALELSLKDPNIILRSNKMLDEILRIVNLPRTKVVSFKALSETPEDDAHALANAFIKKHQLKEFRHFGFNNPNPSNGNPVYGYEIWITVTKDYSGEVMKELKGGLYASLTTSMSNIFENWQRLNKMIGESNTYDFDVQYIKKDSTYDHQWLEEITDYDYFSDPKNDFFSKQLDLLMPIIRI